MKYLLIILIQLLLSCRNDNIRIVRIIDADTFIDNNGDHLRLSTCDAVELTQTYGLQAKIFAEKWLLNKELNIREQGKDKYNRTLVEIYVEGNDFAELLVKNGMAHVYRRFSSDYMYNLYLEAKKNKIGLFQYPYEFPFIYRNKYKIR